MSKLLISKLYNISRSSLYTWDKEGNIYHEAAKRGVAIHPAEVERILFAVDSQKFNRLDKFPPNKLTDDEKEWFRISYTYPGGPIIDPRPRVDALKGVYYNERRGKWKPRPYLTIPS